MIRKIRSRKHKGAIFLYDTDREAYIAKVYAIEDSEWIANKIVDIFKKEAK